MWLLTVEAVTAVYLIVGALTIDANSNMASKVLFKVVPFALGLLLAIAVAGKLLGWPI